MPRSWYQSTRQLVHGWLTDLRETFRLHFRRVETFAWPLGITAWEVAYVIDFYPEVFGGLFNWNHWPTRGIPLGFGVHSQRLHTEIIAQVQGDQILVDAPALVSVPCQWHQASLIRDSALLPRFVRPHTLPHFLITAPRFTQVPPASLVIRRPNLPGRMRVEPFPSPRVNRFAALRSRSRAFPVHQKILPIQRKPIPAHRFSSDHRVKFRELLAQKARLPAIDIQIVGVYDRIFLGLFQSLRQGEEGTLFCTPKPANDPMLRDKEMVPVYLIVGKSHKAPGKAFQVILPMSELER